MFKDSAAQSLAARSLAVEGGSSWVSISHWSPQTVSSLAPIAPIRAERPRAALSSFRKYLASIITSGRCATASPREGYAAIAPALFDRQQPNFESGYSPDEIANARKFVANPDWGAMMKDMQAAIDEAEEKRPCRDRRLLHRRQHRLSRRRQAQRPFGRRRLLRRPDRQECGREAESADATAFRREGRLDPDERRRYRQTESAAAIARSTSIPTRSTASIARSAAATTKPPPSSLAALA